jgi:hypothetical protein
MKRLGVIQVLGSLCLLSCGEPPPAGEGTKNIDQLPRTTDHDPLVKGGATMPRKHTFLGTFTPSTGDWTLKRQRPGWPDGSYVDPNGTLQPGVITDLIFRYGNPNDTPIVGDWDGNGSETQGVWRQGTFFLANTLGGPADLTFSYQLSTDVPVVGDWNGDGTTTVGVYRNGNFLLKNSNSTGAADITFQFGLAGDIPLAGDWDGDGTDNVGVYRPSNATFYLSYAFVSGHTPDVTLPFGNMGAAPIVGDWNEDGASTIGVLQSNFAFVTNNLGSGFGEIRVPLGATGDIPVAGNWNPSAPTGLSTAPLNSFFPLGVWAEPASSFSKWAGRGINTVVGDGGPDIETWTATANQLGLKMIREARPNPADDLTEANLLAWFLVDEPDINGAGSMFQVPQIRANYQALRSYNSTIPIVLDLAGDHIENGSDQLPGDGISNGPDGCSGPGDFPTDMAATACYPTWIGLTDWLLHDYYPVNAHRDVTVVSGMIDKMTRWSSKPQFPFVEAAGPIYNAGSTPPTADQMRAEIWLAIIHGARGLTYFTYALCPPDGQWCPDGMTTAQIDEMTAQNQRITSLASVLQTTINPTSIGFRSGQPLQATWRVSGSTKYFIVLNVSPTTLTNRSMTVTGFTPSSPFTVVGENRTLPASTTLTDTFTPYQVHIYRTP